MNTKLLEININDSIIRGILVLPNVETSKVTILIHGFSRTATTEKKFKVLADNLADAGIASFRFDFTGLGLSDGDFRTTTVDIMTNIVSNLIEQLKTSHNLTTTSSVSHSLGGCIVANLLHNGIPLEKNILISPALNQKELMRMWFVTGVMKKQNIEITWQNYKDYLNENNFISDCNREDKMTKTDFINKEYFLENKDKDYSKLFERYKNSILHIHGDADEAVPQESLNINFDNKIIVTKGNHDLERPDFLIQWLDKAIRFLSL